MKVQFEELFPWEFAQAIARFPLCYLPLGVLEWHGEHNAVGLDALKAHAICVRAAQLSGGIVAPLLYWATDTREDLPDGTYITGGVEHGERYHVPGSMFWIRPETYFNMLLDIYETMRRRGFRAILVLAGHWSSGTVPTIQASGEAFLAQHPEMRWQMATDLELGADLPYLHEHAAGGETSILMALRPDLVDLDKTFETAKTLAPYYAALPEHLKRRGETKHKYIGVLTAAADGSNDPETTASAERGRMLVESIAARLAQRAREMLEEAQ
jgi:creatinine amidohydrolase